MSIFITKLDIPKEVQTHHDTMTLKIKGINVEGHPESMAINLPLLKDMKDEYQKSITEHVVGKPFCFCSQCAYSYNTSIFSSLICGRLLMNGNIVDSSRVVQVDDFCSQGIPKNEFFREIEEDRDEQIH